MANIVTWTLTNVVKNITMNTAKTWFRLDLLDPKKKNKKVSSSWYPSKNSAFNAKKALISTPFGNYNTTFQRGDDLYSATHKYGGWIVKGPVEDKECQFV